VVCINGRNLKGVGGLQMPLKEVLYNTICTALCSIKFYPLVIASSKFCFTNAFFMQSCPALLVFRAKQ